MSDREQGFYYGWVIVAVMGTSRAVTMGMGSLNFGLFLRHRVRRRVRGGVDLFIRDAGQVYSSAISEGERADHRHAAAEKASRQ